MIDQFENAAVPFTNELAQRIKLQIRSQIGQIREGGTENLEGFNRAKFLLNAQKLTGLELKRLKNYIDSLPRNTEGKIDDPAYLLIGGDALSTFVQEETLRLRHMINKAEENKEELGKTEKQDITPAAPPDTEEVTGLPRITGGLGLHEEIIKIKQLIHY